MNTVERLNAAIAHFVSRPENAVLRPATGSYSTPFRGQLFSHEKASDVEDELGRRPASVLFLGANPNCPDSLRFLKSQAAAAGHWPGFVRQADSGYFGECVVDDTGAQRAWDPLHNPSSMGGGQRASWTFYAEAIRSGTGSLEGVAMANVFPWGSGELNDLVQHLIAHDPALLDRVINLANEQLAVIIGALRPGLVLCPRSVSNHGALRALVLSRANARDPVGTSPAELAGRAFRMERGAVAVGGHGQEVLFLNHPAALRWHLKVDRPRIGMAIAGAIRDGLELHDGAG